MMDKKLLGMLICPTCNSPLVYDKQQAILICKADKLAYPIIDDVPRMLIDEASPLTLEEVKQYD